MSKSPNELAQELLLAIDRSDKKEIILLLENGADVNYESTKGKWAGWTPLLYSLNISNRSIASLLIENNADVNYENKKGKLGGITPLLCAIGDDNKDMVSLLIENNADVNYENKKGKLGGITPLLCAIGDDNKEMVSLLIESGADVNYVNKDEKKPLKFALAMKNYEIAKMLQNAIGLSPSASNHSKKIQSSSSAQTSVQTFAQPFLQKENSASFLAALVLLSKIVAKYGEEIFLKKNVQKLCGLLSDLLSHENEFFQKLKAAFLCGFSETIFLALKKNEDEQKAAFKAASQKIEAKAFLNKEDAFAISMLTALSLGFEMEERFFMQGEKLCPQ